MPDSTHKSDAELEMSDLVGPTASPAPAPASPTQEPIVDTPAGPTPGDSVRPAAPNSLPVFRNPLAAGATAQMSDFGVRPPAPTPGVAGAAALPPLRPNLAPHFDTFSHHGIEEKAAPLTLLGKLRETLRLDGILSKRNLRYAGIGLVSFAIFFFIFNFQTLTTEISYWLNPPAPQAPITSTTPEAEIASASGSQAEAAPPGDIITIPKLNVTNIPIVFEPSIEEAAIQKSLQRGVVHYNGTATPGQRSNAVIVGHSSNDWWEPGSYKFVFALLDKLVPGDQIQVNYQQKKYVYEVTGSKVVEPTEISVLQPTDQAQLTLITCTPPGTSWKRLVVVAKQINPIPDAPTDKTTVATATEQKADNVALPGNAPSFFDQLKRWLGLAKEPTPSS